MGLLGFAAKIGILAYAYNWATGGCENDEERSTSAEAKRQKWAKKWDEALTTMTGASSDDSMREWSNRFHSRFRRYEDHCGTIRSPRSWVERTGTDTDYTLVVEVPGLKKEDLKISSIDDSHQISVRGSTRPVAVPPIIRKSDNGEKLVSPHVSEPCTRKVDAKVFVPFLADIKNAKVATLEDGVLRITMPGRDTSGRQIPIA
ncbi:hypothetical protein BJ742DRAFT_779048 [Cladochytrium replicatum]|nr:hypothetical protein BJ742DRAFT_779048 [Cladochytrium replicatum]